MSEAPLRECPQCGEEKVRRLINGGGGIIFKGSGFYVTDKSKSAASGGAKDGGAKSGGDTKTTSSAGTGAGEKSGGEKGKESVPASPACRSCPASAAAGGSCSASSATTAAPK